MARRGSSDRADPAALDYTRRFVRVTGERADGFVAFDFAIGDPDVSIEMMLGREAFAAFCADNKVEVLPAAAEPRHAASDWDWRMADATRTRFR